MKAEMKKNNKMVLALAVVAALAMVSVAGISVLQSDDSDASGIYYPLTGTPAAPFIIDDTVSGSYDFYVYEGVAYGALSIVVTKDAKYTGTLRIGTLSADGLVYTPYTSIELKDASAVQLTAVAIDASQDLTALTPTLSNTSGFVSFFAIGNSDKTVGGTLPSGTYELKQGQALLGSLKADTAVAKVVQSGFVLDSVAANFETSFSGKITAGGFSATASYVVGMYVALDSAGNARISGAAGSPDAVLPNDPQNGYPELKERTLLFEGAASVQFPEAIQKNLDNNLGAIILGSSTTTSVDVLKTDSVNVTVAEGAVITVGDRQGTVAQTVTFDSHDNVEGAFLIGSKGEVHSANVATATAPEFSDVPYGTYTLIVYTATDVWYSTGATVSATGLVLGSNYLGGASVPGAAGPITAVNTTDGYFGFTSADYSFVYAFDITAGKQVSAGADSTDTTVFTIGDNDAANASNKIFVVLRSKTAGSPVVGFLGAKNATANDATGILSIASGTSSNAKEIKTGTNSVAPAGAVSTYYTTLGAQSILVKGEINVIYTGSNVYGVLDIASAQSGLSFEGTGILAYGVAPALNPAIPTTVSGSANLVAAYYYVNETNKSTYYFTSLENGILKNNEITLLGKNVIVKDTTLDNPAFESINIILGPGASLEVGDGKASPVLTVPGKTTITVPSSADHYEVVSGQAVYDVKPTAANAPAADILISGDKYIYTDLATALDISVSGDVLELRRDAELKRDAAVKAGVELKDGGKKLTIPEKTTLTVDGTLTATGTTEINGTIRVNGKAAFSNSAAATFGDSGAIDITKDGEVTVDDARIDGAIGKGAITVSGKLAVSNGANVSAGAVIVTGSVNVSSGSKLVVYDKLTLGEQPTLSPLSSTYTNPASITGQIALETSAVAYAYGAFALGTGSSAKLASATPGGSLVSTVYNIDGTAYLTIYADSATTAKLPVLFEDQLKDITIRSWNNERYLRGDTLAANAKTIGQTGWEAVHADWSWKMYSVTFEYAQGVTWSVGGVNLNGGQVVSAHYGEKIVVKAFVQPGYEGTPVLKAGSAAYTAGSEYSVTGNVTFTATGVQQVTSGGSGNSGNDGLTLIEILLIIIVVIIAVIAIIVAIRLMRS